MFRTEIKVNGELVESYEGVKLRRAIHIIKYFTEKTHPSEFDTNIDEADLEITIKTMK